MAEAWRFIAFLPNVDVVDSIVWDQIGLFSHREAKDVISDKNFDNIIERFTDEFGSPISPGVILAKSARFEKEITVESVASFRDAISVSCVAYNRARAILGHKALLIAYANAFWMYPWMWQEGSEWVASSTAAFGGLNRADQLTGHSEPTFAIRKLRTSDIDQSLLKKISVYWRRHYTSKRRHWRDRVLFRSLNMAHQASLTPGGADMTFYDVGRVVALWVSAFEILAHPRNGRADFLAVYSLLERASYGEPKLTARRYRAHGTKVGVRKSIPCWLYGEIHKARNDFLHGNPISFSRLNLSSSQHTLFEHAAPLYRIGLGSFLGLSQAISPPGKNESERQRGIAIARWINRSRVLDDIERATLLSRTGAPASSDDVD